MAKIRTANQLQDHLDKDMGWRAKEIATLKSGIRSAAGSSEKTLLRAGTALLYAHWEGFVKNASRAYLNYVDCQNLNYLDLKNCFAVFGFKSHLNTLVSSQRASANLEAIEFVINGLRKQTNFSFDSAINTESNLSSKVFKNIALSLDIQTTSYETRFNLIDESLLKRRNRIAHGEYLDIDAKAWLPLADEVLHLMRLYKTDIENSAALGSFKRS